MLSRRDSQRAPFVSSVAAHTWRVTDRQTLYVDMDNVLVDFPSGIARVEPKLAAEYSGRFDEVPGIFALMDPMPGAVESFIALSAVYDTYILSTAPWLNPSAWTDKVTWVQRHFGSEPGTPGYKRLILSHHKHLNRGDILIDDRPQNGADRFEGELILFGSDRWPTWNEVTDYLLARVGQPRLEVHPLERRFVEEMLDRLRSLNNVTRGVFAETVVAASLPGAKLQPDGYDAVDIVWEGIPIQVKCSGGRQAWHAPDARPARPSWRVPQTRRSLPNGKISSEPPKRWADVWVLARHEGDAIFDGWRFYVAPVTLLDDLLGTKGQSVSDRTLEAHGVQPVGLEDLAAAVKFASGS